MKITIQINGTPVEMTVEEARRVFAELASVFIAKAEERGIAQPIEPIRYQPFQPYWLHQPITMAGGVGRPPGMQPEVMCEVPSTGCAPLKGLAGAGISAASFGYHEK